MNRREVLQAAGLAVAASVLPELSADDTPASKRTQIAMLVYPEFTALDLVGPHQVFAQLSGYDVKLVYKSRDPVTSDAGLTVIPNISFKDCPEELAVLFVPGGTLGTIKAMGDEEVLAFLKSRGAKSDYVTSVCTGSLVIGAAGLLRGYKATSHWLARDVLKSLGAEPVDERVVRDRNRLTGGGVTAGIDFGLTLASTLKGEDQAKRVQLMMEYDPLPPFKSGSPKQASAEMTKQMRSMAIPFVKLAIAAAEKAKKTW